MKYFVIFIRDRNSYEKGITEAYHARRKLQFLPNELQFHGRATWQKPTFKV